jgi:hypothetical protein
MVEFRHLGKKPPFLLKSSLPKFRPRVLRVRILQCGRDQNGQRDWNGDSGTARISAAPSLQHVALPGPSNVAVLARSLCSIAPASLSRTVGSLGPGGIKRRYSTPSVPPE